MEKSIYSEVYGAFLRQLRAARNDAGRTQEDVADALRVSQSLISKWERGERRMDLAQLRAYCEAIGVPLVQFVERVERELAERKTAG